MALTLGATANVIDVFTASTGALVERAQIIVVIAQSPVCRERVAWTDESGAIAGFFQVAVTRRRPTHYGRCGSTAALACSTATRFTRRAGVAIVATAAQVIELTRSRSVASVLTATLHGARAAGRSAGQQPIAGVNRRQMQLLDLDRCQWVIEYVDFVDPPGEWQSAATVVAEPQEVELNWNCG
jgi:hypothetical protein